MTPHEVCYYIARNVRIMETVLFAGYPKTGNTLVGQSLNYAGGIDQAPYGDIFIRRNQLTPTPNPLFETNTCCIKTHDSYHPFRNIDNLYFGKVSKIVVFNRNPFDLLLSAINYFRVVFERQGGKFDPSKEVALQYRRSLMLLIPDFEVKETFLSDFSLETLRDNGMLDIALRNFGENGTSILNFYPLSGTWSEFTASYDGCGISLLKFSYEKLEQISINSTRKDDVVSAELQELSSFLEVDSERLNQGFAKQSRLVSEKKSESGGGAKFFNKSCSGYWKQYFSKKECRYFLNHHHSAVVRNGYEYLIDEVSSM